MHRETQFKCCRSLEGGDHLTNGRMEDFKQEMPSMLTMKDKQNFNRRKGLRTFRGEGDV